MPVTTSEPQRIGAARARGQPAAAGAFRLVPAIDGERRAQVEDLIRRRYAERYQARIRRFMPCLLGLEASDGRVLGAVGCRSAQDGTLFLERYLGEPIERAIERRVGRPVARGTVVEVGNLAAEGSGAARRLIVSLTGLLAEAGFRWVAFTGTPSLLNSFHRLGLAPCPIAPADPACVAGELADWGSYYDHRPQVMAGEILAGRRSLAATAACAPAAAHLDDATEVLHVACH